ncbi:hypothetical protein [Archangium sp.]|uniref:hypothetical protein n=1 Tax=Archangium sp. TaxID=1872627 RepID=UPI00389AB9C9
MTTRRLTPVLLGGLGALAAACQQTPTSEEVLCQNYCYAQLQAVPTQGAATCASSNDYYWEDCVRTCTKDLGTIAESCRTSLVRAYSCGADHGWFCVPQEGGERTLTQFDTCREAWDTFYFCEKALPDSGTP